MITGECKIIGYFKNLSMKHEEHEETDKHPNRVKIVVTSQRTDNRYNLESSKAKAERMGASSRILRLFE